MRIYYLFKINDNFSMLYHNKTFYLYKILEQISKSDKNDFMVSYRLFEQLTNPFNKSEVNSAIYTHFYYDNSYNKENEKHIYDDGIENTKLYIHSTYIKIKTNKNITKFFNVLKYENNLFICDFNNKDYFWLNKALQKNVAQKANI